MTDDLKTLALEALVELHERRDKGGHTPGCPCQSHGEESEHMTRQGCPELRRLVGWRELAEIFGELKR